MERLGIHGYAVQGRTGETYLDQKVPEEIRKFYPSEFLLTHFWVEVQLDNNWHILDASYDIGLSKAGFIVNEWESNKTCFDITKAYTQEEVIAYCAEWNNPDYARRYFEAITPCALALNKWYEAQRSGAAT